MKAVNDASRVLLRRRTIIQAVVVIGLVCAVAVLQRRVEEAHAGTSTLVSNNKKLKIENDGLREKLKKCNVKIEQLTTAVETSQEFQELALLQFHSLKLSMAKLRNKAEVNARIAEQERRMRLEMEAKLQQQKP
jgi:hypothetical protein